MSGHSLRLLNATNVAWHEQGATFDSRLKIQAQRRTYQPVYEHSQAQASRKPLQMLAKEDPLIMGLQPGTPLKSFLFQGLRRKTSRERRRRPWREMNLKGSISWGCKFGAWRVHLWGLKAHSSRCVRFGDPRVPASVPGLKISA